MVATGFDIIGIILLLIIFICGIFEVSILVYAYFNADRVECNLLWCNFITERNLKEEQVTNIKSSTIIETTDCYKNGIKINCSEINYMNLNNWS